MGRTFIINNKSTYHDFNLYLTGKSITPPEPKTNYIELDGANGSLDLSEALTGEVAYKDRTLTASFFRDEGTRLERETLLRDLTRMLHGHKVKIIEPDDLEHYYLGRAKITNLKNTASHTEFNIEAQCEPWRYAIEETNRRVDVNSQDLTRVVINNKGLRTVCPNINIVGNVNIIIGGVVNSLSTGDYKISSLKLKHGYNIVNVSGSGSVTFKYREADI